MSQDNPNVEGLMALVEDYGAARAEVALFNVTQRSGMNVRLPAPRLRAIREYAHRLSELKQESGGQVPNTQWEEFGKHHAAVKLLESLGWTWDGNTAAWSAHGVPGTVNDQGEKR